METALHDFMLNYNHAEPDIFCFKKSLDPDQLSFEKPADQDPQLCNSPCIYMPF